MTVTKVKKCAFSKCNNDLQQSYMLVPRESDIGLLEELEERIVGPNAKLYCDDHWKLLPPELKQAIADAYISEPNKLTSLKNDANWALKRALGQ